MITNDDPEQFTFFYKTSSPFSQWHAARFRVEEGYLCYHPATEMEFNCSEQYMMYMKAMHFGDRDTAKLIMEASQPREQKELGRLVKGFRKDEWERVCIRIVYRGNYFKFIQNPKLLRKLIATAGTTLVEASPTDILWGVGLSENDPLIHDRKNWRGQNWLGEVLTRVRNDIMNGVTQTY
jgi:hypothetical protein